MNDLYQSPAYKRSRMAYHGQCVSEYLVTILIEDAFLAKLLKTLGLSDATVGIVGSLTALAFLVQLVNIFMAQFIRNVKKTVIFIDIASMLCFMCVFFLPFLQLPQSLRTLLVFVTIGGGYVLKYLQLNLYFKWGNSFVEPHRRGAFSTRNEAISLGVGVIFTLAMGALVDHYERMGQLEQSFMIIAFIIAGLTIMDFVMLLLIKNQPAEETQKQQKPLKDVLKNTLGNKNFRNVVMMLSLSNIAFFFTMGFMGTFKTEDLMLSVGFIQVINVIACGIRCVLSTPIGRWADRTSFAYVYRIGMWLSALCFGLLIFTTRATWWLIVVHTLVFSIADACTSTNTDNMTYNYVPIDYFVQAQALRSSISGVLGFLSSLLGGWVLSLIQQNGNQVLGISAYGQQVLALCSLLMTIGIIIMNKRVISKQQIMVQ